MVSFPKKKLPNILFFIVLFFTLSYFFSTFQISLFYKAELESTLESTFTMCVVDLSTLCHGCNMSS